MDFGCLISDQGGTGYFGELEEALMQGVDGIRSDSGGKGRPFCVFPFFVDLFQFTHRLHHNRLCLFHHSDNMKLENLNGVTPHTWNPTNPNFISSVVLFNSLQPLHRERISSMLKN